MTVATEALSEHNKPMGQGICLPFQGFSRSGGTISIGPFRAFTEDRVDDFNFDASLISLRCLPRRLERGRCHFFGYCCLLVAVAVLVVERALG